MDILNDILACVSVALDTLFPDYPVYTELVPEKLPKRCFLLGFAGDVESRRELNFRYQISGQLDIAYICPVRESSSRQECNRVFSTLSLKLRHLAFGEVKLRLEQHSRRDVDGVLHDICSFATFLQEQNDTPPIGRIQVQPAIKL